MTIKEGYTRVSSILGQWDKFGHIDPKVLANKCRIGTEVHQSIEAYIKHGITPSDNLGYFESYRDWESKSGAINVTTEQRFYCDKLQITGCVDAIVRFEDRKEFVMIDYKTSVQESPKSWPLQACFYHYLAITNCVPIGDRIIFLKLDKDGKEAKVFEYQYSTQLMNVCMSALNCYRWLNS